MIGQGTSRGKQKEWGEKFIGFRRDMSGDEHDEVKFNASL